MASLWKVDAKYTQQDEDSFTVPVPAGAETKSFFQTHNLGDRERGRRHQTRFAGARLRSATEANLVVASSCRPSACSTYSSRTRTCGLWRNGGQKKNLGENVSIAFFFVLCATKTTFIVKKQIELPGLEELNFFLITTKHLRKTRNGFQKKKKGQTLADSP